MIRLDGKSLAQKTRDQLKKKIDEMPIKPGLAVVLVGADPASQVYVRNKVKACESVGIYSERFDLPQDCSEEKLLSLVEQCNQNPKIHGILVQLPLPKHIDTDRVLSQIAEEKDVDALSVESVGKAWLGKAIIHPCTPSGVMEILKEYEISVEGKKAVVIGRSDIVGKPMAQLLLAANATVTICHSRTKDVKAYTQDADIVVVAAGKPKAFDKSYFKKDAVVIDVGIHRIDDKLCGDVEPEGLADHIEALTPVPGGVGPMTIAMLLENTYKLAQAAKG